MFMQITETNAEGLKRQLKVVVGAAELNQRFSARLDEIKDRVQLKGFRKGKVPVAHLKKVFGRSLMAEVLEQMVEETSRQALNDRHERPAFPPRIELPEDKEEIERVIGGTADLAFKMSFEVLPEIKLMDFSELKLERLVANVDDAAVDKAIDDLVARNTSYELVEGRAAGHGDRLTIDYIGKIDGQPFEGGSGEGAFLGIGQGGFLAGFEDGLIGARAGEERVVTVTFPTDYGVKTLAGKTAVFDVKVKEVAAPKKPDVNDEFAKTLGAETLLQLRELVAQQIKREYDAASRAQLKGALLDELEKRHEFALPPSLVDREFEMIWRRVTEELKREGKTFEDEGKTEEAARAEYRKIAERRVRLGLIVGEIGDKNKIQVTQDEVRRALVEQARRFPGQARYIYEFYEKNPGAITELKAPIFEDKVVDFVLELAKPFERSVSREELATADHGSA
jgi:trigger factor